MASGHSPDPDSFSAGAQAARAAVTAPDAALLIVFASEAHDLPALLRGIRSEAPEVPLIGCSTAGEIGTATAGWSGVAVMALGGPGFSVTTAVATGASVRLREAAAEAAACAAENDPRDNSVLVLLTDGLAGDQQEVVRGAYGVLGAEVPLVGGCAGDDLKMARTYQFYGDEVLTDAIVCASLSSDAPIGVGVEHGWRRVGDTFVVTSGDCRVHTLDGRPALDVYLDRLDAPAEVRTDPEAFTRFAMTHPLGISRRNGEEVRLIAEADFTERSLVCIADVPDGGLVWIMEGDDQSVLGATDAACATALAALGDHAPLGLLAFDCVARRGVLGDDHLQQEMDRISRHSAAPVAGFYSYGEIARTRGSNGFHNQTLVVLALA